MANIPRCPEDLPEDFSDFIYKLGRLWAEKEPPLECRVIEQWSELLKKWVEDKDMPIFIRKHKDNRGAEITHDSGRILIPTDNSTSNWAYAMALNNKCPSIEEIQKMLTEDKIPIAMVLPPAEKAQAKYQCTLSKELNLNEFNWKLAHIEKVGLYTHSKLNAIPLEKLVFHFCNLLSPANMFIVPKPLGSLAEIDTFIQAFKKYQKYR